MPLASLATLQQRSAESQYQRSSLPCAEYLRPERLPVTEKHAFLRGELHRRRREMVLQYPTASEPSAVPEGPANRTRQRWKRRQSFRIAILPEHAVAVDLSLQLDAVTYRCSRDRPRNIANRC